MLRKRLNSASTPAKNTSAHSHPSSDHRRSLGARWTRPRRRRRCSSRGSDVRTAWWSRSARTRHGRLKHRLLWHRRQHPSARWERPRLLQFVHVARGRDLGRPWRRVGCDNVPSQRAVRPSRMPPSRAQLRRGWSAAPTPSTIGRWQPSHRVSEPVLRLPGLSLRQLFIGRDLRMASLPLASISRRVNGVGQIGVHDDRHRHRAPLIVIARGGELGLRRLQRADLRIGIVEGSICLLELLPVDADLVLIAPRRRRGDRSVRRGTAGCGPFRSLDAGASRRPAWCSRGECNQPLWNPTASVPPPRTSSVSRPEMMTTDRFEEVAWRISLFWKHRGQSGGETLSAP